MKISHVYQSIIASFDDWSGFLINPRYMRNDHEVSWTKRVTGLYKVIVRESTVKDMADFGQFTFQIADDGSLIQLYYRFAQGTEQIDRARLAFYSAYSGLEPIHGDDQSDELDLSQDSEIEMDRREDLSKPSSIDPPVGWMRIDYNPNAAERGVLHHDCHLHLSAFPDARFIVNSVPSPKQFIEFVIASAYADKYKEHRLELDAANNSSSKMWKYGNPEQMANLNDDCIPLPDNPIYEQLTHFCVPSG